MNERRVVQVKVFAGAKKEKINKIKDDYFEVFVREPAQHNLANYRVRELIAYEYEVPLGSVQLRTGHQSPKKTLWVKE